MTSSQNSTSAQLNSMQVANSESSIFSLSNDDIKEDSPLKA